MRLQNYFVPSQHILTVKYLYALFNVLSLNAYRHIHTCVCLFVLIYILAFTSNSADTSSDKTISFYFFCFTALKPKSFLTNECFISLRIVSYLLANITETIVESYFLLYYLSFFVDAD